MRAQLNWRPPRKLGSVWWLVLIVGIIGPLLLPRPALAASWSKQATINPPELSDAELTGVSCVTASICLAVGNGGVGPVDESTASAIFGETWDGSAWSEAPIAASAGQHPGLSAVSCTNPNFCMAVGGTQGSRAAASSIASDTPLAQTWNGEAWTALAIPQPRGSRYSSLSGVSCLSSTFCVAVGTGGFGSRSAGLATSWNGTRWQTQQLRVAGSVSSQLDAISCVTQTACTAVGSYAVRTGRFTANGYALALRWNGSKWLRQSISEYRGDRLGWAVGLASVSCPTSTFCMAAGTADPQGNGDPTPITERWGAGRWSAVRTGLPKLPTLPPNVPNGVLDGVSCSTPDSCLAVGQLEKERGQQTLEAYAALWNGKSWDRQELQPTAGEPTLLSVSCASAAACTAVGSAGASGQTQPLAESDAGSAGGPVAIG